MSARIASGTDLAVLDTVLEARHLGVPCVVPPVHLRVDIPDVVVEGPHLVAFSSGSTGASRGIVRTHASWTASHAPLTRLLGLSAADIVWLPGPLTSTLFLYGAVHAVESGARIRLAADEPRDITIAHTVPLQAAQLLSDPPRTLRAIVVAGDRVSVDLHERAASAGIVLVDYYGAAELSFVAYRTGPTPYLPFPGARIREAEGALWVASPYVCEGYVDAATNGPLRHDGEWCTVGDLGRVTPAGIFVDGRGDEAVTIAGHTVLIADVEEHLRRSLAVDVTVIGIDRAPVGQVVVAVTTTPVDDEQRRLAAAGLPDAARPRRWLTLPALPLTAGGKVDRVALRRAVDAHG